MAHLKISVVTVCYNMEKYIERTIRSVLSQGYDNLEYIIIDGGSKDKTMDVVNKYKEQISIIVSEPDNGMYDAIRKGFSMATGDILAWINADDQYMPWAFKTANSIFSKYQDVDWISGLPAFANEGGTLFEIFPNSGAKPKDYIAKGYFRSELYGCLLQEGMFWRRSLYEKSGGISTDYRYAGDFELWTRFAKYAELVSISIPMAMFTRRKDSLSIGGQDKYLDETHAILMEKELTGYPNQFVKLCASVTFLRQLVRLLIYKRAKLIIPDKYDEDFCLIASVRNISYFNFSFNIKNFFSRQDCLTK